MTTDGPLTLEQLVAPTPLGRWRDEHWGRTTVHLPGGAGRIAGWRDARGWRSWAHTELHAASLDDAGIQQREAIGAEQIEGRLDAGATVCADVSADTRVRPLLADLTACLAASRGRPFAKLYLSGPNRGYVLHTDRFHVMVVQLSGRKRWWVGERPAVANATAGSEVDLQGQAVLTHPHQSMPMVGDDGTPVRPPSDDQLCEYELSPGDALYVPPGTWHRTQAVTRSAAISLSPPRTPVMELVTAVMTRALMADPHFRADLGGAEAATVVRERWDDLRAQLETLDPRAVHRAWAIEHERGLASLGAFVAAADTQLGPDHVVVRDPARPLRWLVADADDGTGDAVYFYGGGQEWSLPIAGLAWIQRLAIRSRFTVREAMAWAPTLGGQDALAVLTELVSAGVLSVACDPAPA